MSQSSIPPPGRAALLGLGLIVGTYLIWRSWPTSKSAKSSSRLRRSNAVHRPRARRPRPPAATSLISVDTEGPDGDSPLGSLVLTSGNSSLTFKIGLMDLPTSTQIQEAFGTCSDSTLEEVEGEVVAAVLFACLVARSPAERSPFADLGLHDLLIAVQEYNHDGVRAAEAKLQVLLPTISMRAIDDAVEKFLAEFEALGSLRDELEQSALAADSGDDAIAETENLDSVEDMTREPSQELKGLLYHIAEEDARRKAFEHRGIACEECGENPIRDVRSADRTRQDSRVCEDQDTLTCALAANQTVSSMVSRDPISINKPTDVATRKLLAQEHGLDEISVEAFHDQYSCIAVAVPSPTGAKSDSWITAINKKAFTLALTSERWPNRLAPNVLYDRLFSFYDTNQDGLVGFSEFVSGLAYLRGPKRFESLRRTLQGFDMDGDGFIDRSDFIHLFRAKYDIQRRLIMDMVESHEAEQTQAAMDTLRRSQPISSIFNTEDLPFGETRQPSGKVKGTSGDMLQLYDTKTILDEWDPWPQEGDDDEAHARKQLSDQVSRLQASVDSSRSEAHDVASSVSNASEQGSPSATTQETFRIGENLPNHELIWQIVEDSLNEMVDPLFLERENLDDKAMASHSERMRWSKEINDASAEELAFHQDLQSAALVDPLMATAARSYPGARTIKRADDTLVIALKSNVVPTDDASLAQRAEEIAQRPLEDLLRETGYGIVNHESSLAESITTSEDVAGDGANIKETQVVSMATQADNVVDSTMPQYMPNAATSATVDDQPTSTKTTQDVTSEMPPSRARLEELAAHAVAELEIERRHGPGKMSLVEVEEIVNAQITRDLRGLITSWLEWASF